MAIVNINVADAIRNNPDALQQVIDQIIEQLNINEGSGGTGGDVYTLEATDGQGEVTVTLNAQTGDDSNIVLEQGNGITINESNGTITFTATAAGDLSGAVRVNTTTGAIYTTEDQEDTSTFQWLYRYLHVRFSSSSDGANFVTNPRDITGTTIYIGLANRTTTTAPTLNSDYQWTEFTWSTAHNVFYTFEGGFRLDFLTSTQSELTTAILFEDGDSPLDLRVNELSDITPNVGMLTTGILQGGNLTTDDPANNAPNATGSYFNLTGGNFLVGSNDTYARFNVTNSTFRVEGSELIGSRYQTDEDLMFDNSTRQFIFNDDRVNTVIDGVFADEGGSFFTGSIDTREAWADDANSAFFQSVPPLQSGNLFFPGVITAGGRFQIRGDELVPEEDTIVGDVTYTHSTGIFSVTVEDGFTTLSNRRGRLVYAGSPAFELAINGQLVTSTASGDNFTLTFTQDNCVFLSGSALTADATLANADCTWFEDDTAVGSVSFGPANMEFTTTDTDNNTPLKTVETNIVATKAKLRMFDNNAGNVDFAVSSNGIVSANASGGGGGASNTTELDDVSNTAPNDQQFLRYSSSNSEYVPTTITPGSSRGLVGGYQTGGTGMQGSGSLSNNTSLSLTAGSYVVAFEGISGSNPEEDINIIGSTTNWSNSNRVRFPNQFSGNSFSSFDVVIDGEFMNPNDDFTNINSFPEPSYIRATSLTLPNNTTNSSIFTQAGIAQGMTPVYTPGANYTGFVKGNVKPTFYFNNFDNDTTLWEVTGINDFTLATVGNMGEYVWDLANADSVTINANFPGGNSNDRIFGEVSISETNTGGILGVAYRYANSSNYVTSTNLISVELSGLPLDNAVYDDIIADLPQDTFPTNIDSANGEIVIQRPDEADVQVELYAVNGSLDLEQNTNLGGNATRFSRVYLEPNSTGNISGGWFNGNGTNLGTFSIWDDASADWDSYGQQDFTVAAESGSNTNFIATTSNKEPESLIESDSIIADHPLPSYNNTNSTGIFTTNAEFQPGLLFIYSNGNFTISGDFYQVNQNSDVLSDNTTRVTEVTDASVAYQYKEIT